MTSLETAMKEVLNFEGGMTDKNIIGDCFQNVRDDGTGKERASPALTSGPRLRVRACNLGRARRLVPRR